MKLKKVHVQRFRNFVEAQTLDVEADVTCLVGKNESGKTTLLEALHRLKPANGHSVRFNVTTEYPMWRLSRDRRDSDLGGIEPVVAEFELEQEDLDRLDKVLPEVLPLGTRCRAARRFDNKYTVSLNADATAVISAALDGTLAQTDNDALTQQQSVEEADGLAKDLVAAYKESDPERAKALRAFRRRMKNLGHLVGRVQLDQDQQKAVWALIPKFFYFSSYELLPGEADLTELAEKAAGDDDLSGEERTVLALMARAGQVPEDFLDEDYTSRKAELQAAASELTQEVFRYWTQNRDLDVVLDAPLVVHSQNPQGGDITHRLLKVELRDHRHGGVETNFETRSAGFRWFLSFFAAFSEYQDSADDLVVLLDEPGTSLHGDAQRDFVRFIYEELGQSKQVVYTTHSQHMIDVGRYEKLRAIHDRATRSDPDQGVEVTRVALSSDSTTVLPVEAAIGYSIAQHLFLGSGHHLVVEGSSDMAYLLALSSELGERNRTTLDPRFAIIPAGSIDNVPPFVALFGRRLAITALIDGARTSRQRDRAAKAAEANGLDVKKTIVVIGELDGLPTSGDVEDLFATSDYVGLYNRAFAKNVSEADLASSSEPILKRLADVVGGFDHALPAHTLTIERQEFGPRLSEDTLGAFEALIVRLNGCLPDRH